MLVKKYKVFAFIVTITIVLFVFLFYKISIIEVFNAIKKANLRIIVLTLSISVISNILISSYRWKLILEGLNCPIAWRECLLIKMGSDSIISALPLKIGEATRALYLKRVKKISYHKSVFSIVGEYSLNILMLLFFILMGAMLYWLISKNSISYKELCFGPVLFLFSNKKLNFLNNQRKKIFNGCLKWHPKYFRVILFSRSILLCTFLLGAAELANVYLIAKAVNIFIPLYAILLYVPLVILIGSTPITFSGLGLRESAMLFFFFKYASPEKILSLGILYSFIEHLVPMMIGLSLTGFFMRKLFFRHT